MGEPEGIAWGVARVRVRARARTRVRHVLRAVLVLIAACSVQWAAAGSAQAWTNPADPMTPYLTDGTITRMARSGDRLYVAGNFEYFGRATTAGRYGINGDGAPGFPVVTGGRVSAIESDGAGGWYLGGTFTHVGGVARTRLAHVRADDSVDPSFAPAVDGEVLSLRRDGAVLYVGGDFDVVNGAPRSNLAALNAATGVPNAWLPEPNDVVRALTLDGARLYVGGAFTTFAGQNRVQLAAVNRADRSLVDWVPATGGTVHCIAVDGNDVYAGGAMGSMGLRKIDATTGAISNWNDLRSLNGIVEGIHVDATGVYVAGGLNTTSHRDRLVKLSKADASVIWAVPGNGNPNATHALGVANGELLLPNADRTPADAFDPADGIIARIDPATGTLVGHHSLLGSDVRAIAVDGADVVAGGDVTSIGGATRHGLAALDLATGAPTSWNPAPDGPSWNSRLLGYRAYPTSLPVRDIEVHGGLVWVAGSFTRIGGEARRGVAALDPATAAATAWNANVEDGIVRDVDPGADAVVIGGTFTTVDGQQRTRIAKLDPLSGAVDAAFAPELTGSTVTALDRHADTVYVAGAFTEVDGAGRRGMAALDLDDGSLLPWDPRAQREVGMVQPAPPHTDEIIATADGVFVAGVFDRAGPEHDRRAIGSVVKLDPASGNPVPQWNIQDPPQRAWDIELDAAAGTLFVAGLDSSFLGTAIAYLGEVDVQTAQVGWPYVYGTGELYSVAAAGGSIYAGGDDQTAGAFRGIRSFFSFTAAPVNTSTPHVSGTLGLGQELTCEPGSWSGDSVVLAYQWRRNGVDIAGATGATHVQVGADDGAALSCRVTGRNLDSAVSVTSAAAGTGAPPQNTAAPSVDGTAHYRQSVSCFSGTWNGDPSYEYRWLRNGALIEGATTGTYQLANADGGARIACRVTATNAAGRTIVDSPVRHVPARPAATVLPHLEVNGQAAGNAVPVGTTLTCQRGTWSNAPTAYRYAWQRQDQQGQLTVIAGQSTSTYTTGAADDRSNVTCVVTAENEGGEVDSWASTLVRDKPVATTPPSVSGVVAAGRTVSCNAGVWTGVDWDGQTMFQLDGTDAGNPGATYRVLNDDIGKQLRCVVTRVNQAGETTATSAALLVAGPPQPPSLQWPGSAPSVTAIGDTLQLLRCDQVTWVDGPTSYSFAWYRNGSVIAGSDQQLYTTQPADAGATITCSIVARNAHGASSAAVSWPFAAPGPGTNTAAPVAAGVPAVGQVLTCAPGTWDFLWPSTTKLQWWAGGRAISGATDPTYTVQLADRDTTITCRETFFTPGSAVTAASNGLHVPPPPPESASPPSLTDAPYAGVPSQCAPGSWTFADTYAYAWLRDGVPILGATNREYTPTDADVAAELTCRVTAANETGATARTSAPRMVGAVPPTPANASAPTVTGAEPDGTARIGARLTCARGAWSLVTTYATSWVRTGDGTVLAQGDAFVPTDADAGTEIRCRVTGTNPGGSTEAVSAPVRVTRPPAERQLDSAPPGVTPIETTPPASRPDQPQRVPLVRWLSLPRSNALVRPARAGKVVLGSLACPRAAPSPCRVTVTVTPNQRGLGTRTRLAHATFAARPGTRTKLTPALTKAARSLLARARTRGLKVRLTVAAQNAGRREVVARSLTLRR